MRRFQKTGKSLPGKNLLVSLFLLGMVGASGSVFAEENGDRKHRGGFGISSSSSKLTTTAAVASLLVKQEYVNHEIVAIQEQAAQGKGPHLEALAQLLEEPDSEAFSHWMQSNYGLLFSELDQPKQLLSRIENYRS